MRLSFYADDVTRGTCKSNDVLSTESSLERDSANGVLQVDLVIFGYGSRNALRTRQSNRCPDGDGGGIGCPVMPEDSESSPSMRTQRAAE